MSQALDLFPLIAAQTRTCRFLGKLLLPQRCSWLVLMSRLSVASVTLHPCSVTNATASRLNSSALLLLFPLCVVISHLVMAFYYLNSVSGFSRPHHAFWKAILDAGNDTTDYQRDLRRMIVYRSSSRPRFPLAPVARQSLKSIPAMPSGPGRMLAPTFHLGCQ